MDAGSSRQERSDETVDKILDAAARLYMRRGPAAVSMNDIAKAAECGRSTLYRYFPNREAVQAAYAAREAVRLSETIDSHTADISDPGRRLGEAIFGSLEYIRSRPSLASWVKHGEGAAFLEVTRRPEVFLPMLSQYLPDLTAADERAEWLFRVCLSLLADDMIDPDHERNLIINFVVPTLLDVS